MKRSERLKQLAAGLEKFWIDDRPEIRGTLAERLLRDEEEAFGLTWDQEEELLPERLVLEEGYREAWLADPDVEKNGRPAIAAIDQKWSGKLLPWRLKVLREIVRRYNDFNSIRENASASKFAANGESALRQALLNILEILDRKEASRG